MKVFGAIDRALIEVPQSFARNSFCEDRIVARKLNMEELQLITFACSIKRNRSAVDQAARCHQDVVDEQGVLLRDIQIGKWRMRAKGRARDPNRQCVFHRWLSDTVRGALMNGLTRSLLRTICRPLCRYRSR